MSKSKPTWAFASIISFNRRSQSMASQSVGTKAEKGQLSGAQEVAGLKVAVQITGRPVVDLPIAATVSAYTHESLTDIRTLYDNTAYFGPHLIALIIFSPVFVRDGGAGKRQVTGTWRSMVSNYQLPSSHG